MHFPRLITVWLTLLGATLFPLSSKSWEGDGKPLWPDGTVELNLLLGDAPTYSNSSTPNDNARLAIEAWNPNMKRLQLVALAASTGPALFGNARNDVSFGTTAGGDPIPEDALAVTLIRIDGGVRVEADAVINSNQSWGVYDGYRSRTDYDIRSTLLHEFGHLLGLDHPDEAGQEYVSAVMRSDYSDSYYSNTPLYADDKDGVGALYGFTEVNPSRPPEVHTTLHPKDLEVGEYLQYSVSVTGAQPLSFQWFKNGLPMPGQTASNLLIEPVGLSDAGEYYVEVTNRVGGDSSNTGRVTVRVPDPPMFRDEGGKREVVVGADTTLAFGYTGSDPFTFQWFKDGQPIPGATEEWLSLRRLTATDGGDYQVEISNVSGSVLSPILAVVIMPEPPPVFTTYAPPAPIVLFPGDELSISPSYEGYYGDREFHSNGITMACLSPGKRNRRCGCLTRWTW